ncbi:type IV secretion system protein VirB3 [Xanthomonas oryzae]|uniref:type IV secretion system protein VirB3 n=1 Tax=Xanthomonas oryzae TaxID=347 RepID=UPI000949E23A|nr:VirB3 family type IV secretion system protein [Xanthomonas oryzae]QEJ71082.1 type IV secretion system protein VirB3 [Xanthomonas oryzae pv. oryzae]QIE18171.1 type IV secretion system protein VirB3 [Xanthomonas oryzae pv. oryzae]RBL11934.1 type IV secretion system protein VirB3 [Xanthomonas oryzae pv. oryzae]UXV81056.1 type IV secretion system protein VirB3 [Xanthomonas oryzae pv. oryzae]UXV84856.1 type IV secretion system protein VirB3 [Xanthomonas oryzae pv. oryzae]
MSKNDGIIIDTLFVGPTRPTMFWGVTWQAFVINIIVTMEAFIWTRDLRWLLLFVPIHGICFLICMRDPRTFELLMQWGPTKGFAFFGNFPYWRAATFSPLELHIPPKRSFFRRRKRKSRKVP